MMLVGYARVSTQDQNLDLQKDALTKDGCQEIFTDVASGAQAERDGLAQAIRFLRKGDSLVVWSCQWVTRQVPTARVCSRAVRLVFGVSPQAVFLVSGHGSPRARRRTQPACSPSCRR